MAKLFTPTNTDRHYYTSIEIDPSLTLADRLREALEIVLDTSSRDGDGERYTRVAMLLRDLDDKIPEFDAWAVVKHYYGHVPGGSWEPKVWCACFSKAQAAELAPAIEAYYDDPRHGRDRFLVERRPVRVFDLVPPTMTAAEYVAAEYVAALPPR